MTNIPTSIPEKEHCYCINPSCQHRLNSIHLDNCQSCQTPLLINGRYRLIKPLRKLSSVYPAEIFTLEDNSLDAINCHSPKVLKLLKPTHNQHRIRLFRQEARVLTWLRHPGIPKVEPDGYFLFYPNNSLQPLHCLVMEQIEGDNLEDWIVENGPISQELALDWLQQLAEILNVVHQQRLFHRDIKPSNIMRRPDGKLVLIDFGTAREITPTLLEKWQRRNVTRVNSQGYTAPEQIQGQAIPKSDLFALGRTFVYLLTGICPSEFEDRTTYQLIGWRETALQIEDSLVELIDKLISSESKERPKTPNVLLQEIDKIRSGKYQLQRDRERREEEINSNVRREKKRRFLPGKLAAGLAILGLGGWTFLGDNLSVYFNNQAADSYEVGNLETAESQIRLALLFYPQSNSARYIQGLVLDAKGELQPAYQLYEAVRFRYPDRVASNVGRIEILRGNYEVALSQLQQGLNITEENSVKAGLLKNLGWVLLELGEYETAQNHLSEAIELDSDRPSPYCLMAQVLEAQGNYQDATPYWKMCVDSASNARYRHLQEIQTWVVQAQQRLKASL